MSTNAPPITLYWRPGRRSCERLRHALHDAGVEVEEVDIWEVPQAAAVVRLVADGNETVPTVTIGSTVMVDPSIRSVLAEVRGQASSRPFSDGFASHGWGAPERVWAIVQWVIVAGLIALSLLAEGLGRVAISWELDGLNVALYLVVRSVRRASLGSFRRANGRTR